MKWDNLEQMVEELDLKATPKDIIQIKAELKTKIKELHPDISGGQFKSNEDSEKLYLLLEALDYCDTETNKLIQLDCATEIIKKISENVTRFNKEPLDVQINRTSLYYQANIGQRFQWPKISLGAISAILTYIFLSPDQLRSHPYIGPFLDQYFSFTAWLATVEILAILWFIIWKSETYNKAATSELFSFDYHRNILNQFKHSNKVLFSRTQLKKEFSSIRKNSIISRILHVSLESTAVDDATSLAIERYLERKWIHQINQTNSENNNKDIDDWFQIII